MIAAEVFALVPPQLRNTSYSGSILAARMRVPGKTLCSHH
jgi:hypothetical protein